MAGKLDPKELVSFRELLMSNTVEQEALTKAELLEEIKRLRDRGPAIEI